MKRRMTLSIALVLSVVLLSLLSSDAKAKAQPPQRSMFDTGIIAPSPNQILRITINWGDGAEQAVVRFRRMEYAPGSCNTDGVCKLNVASDTTSPGITLMPGEAASLDFIGGHEVTHGVRGVVISNRPNVRVNTLIIEATTGAIVACIPTGTVTF